MHVSSYSRSVVLSICIARLIYRNTFDCVRFCDAITGVYWPSIGQYRYRREKKNRRALHRLKPEAILKTEFYEYERIASDMPPSTHKQSM